VGPGAVAAGDLPGGFLTTSPMSERPAVCQAIIDAAGELGRFE
jgi:hypothetical protein